MSTSNRGPGIEQYPSVVRPAASSGSEFADNEAKNARLASSNRDLELFASVAAHDLQEPLRKMRMFGERLGHFLGPDVDPQAHDYLQRMMSAASRMSEMLNSLLEISRVGNTSALDGTTELAGTVKDLVESFTETTELSAEIDLDHIPPVVGDPTHLRRLFENLVGNSIKYAVPDKPPKVWITARQSEDGDVIVNIADNGMGFDQKYAEQIFQPFQRLHGRSDYTGSGLGLALCSRIVERLGGSIVAQSSPGEGTTITVRLPSAEEVSS